MSLPSAITEGQSLFIRMLQSSNVICNPTTTKLAVTLAPDKPDIIRSRIEQSSKGLPCDANLADVNQVIVVVKWVTVKVLIFVKRSVLDWNPDCL